MASSIQFCIKKNVEIRLRINNIDKGFCHYTPTKLEKYSDLGMRRDIVWRINLFFSLGGLNLRNK